MLKIKCSPFHFLLYYLYFWQWFQFFTFYYLLHRFIYTMYICCIFLFTMPNICAQNTWKHGLIFTKKQQNWNEDFHILMPKVRSWKSSSFDYSFPSTLRFYEHRYLKSGVNWKFINSLISLALIPRHFLWNALESMPRHFQSCIHWV